MKYMNKIITCLFAVAFSSLPVAGEEIPSEQELLTTYNKAQEAQTAGQHNAALKGFMIVKKHYPDDWRTRAKIVQEYSVLGKKKERDVEIAGLYAFRAKLPKESQSNIAFFCREQHRANQRKLMVLEYFSLQGERAIKYSFLVLDKEGSLRDRPSIEIQGEVEGKR